MTKIIITLIIGLAGSYLGLKLIKQSKKEQNTQVSFLGLITLLCSIFGCVVIVSFLKLKGAAWSDENTALFGIISIISITVPMLFLGIKILLKGKKDNALLLLITGATWMIITSICSYLSIQYVNEVNSGWTNESRLFYLEKCEALANEGKNYKCNCFVDNLMKKYPSPKEYTNALEDEKTGEKENLHIQMDSLCPCGEPNYNEDEIEEVAF